VNSDALDLRSQGRLQSPASARSGSLTATVFSPHRGSFSGSLEPDGIDPAVRSCSALRRVDGDGAGPTADAGEHDREGAEKDPCRDPDESI